jgi:voltage-dependent anion channel protein 2
VSTTIVRKNFRIRHTEDRVQLEGKYVDKATGKDYRIYCNLRTHTVHTSSPQNSSTQDPKSSSLHLPAFTAPTSSPYDSVRLPSHCISLTWCPFRFPGLTLTQTWTTANSLDTKLELEDNLTKGLKAEILSNYLPAKSTYGGKLNLHYKQPNVHVRSFIDLFKGPVATVDLTLGHEGFLVGAEGGYDVQKAAMTKYSLAAGYSQGSYAAAITATNNLSIFSASYYHKVNAEVEAGAKATWDSAAGSNVGLEVASKYKLDPSSFAKVRRSTPPQETGSHGSDPLLTLFLGIG